MQCSRCHSPGNNTRVLPPAVVEYSVLKSDALLTNYTNAVFSRHTADIVPPDVGVSPSSVGGALNGHEHGGCAVVKRQRIEGCEPALSTEILDRKQIIDLR